MTDLSELDELYPAPSRTFEVRNSLGDRLTTRSLDHTADWQATTRERVAAYEAQLASLEPVPTELTVDNLTLFIGCAYGGAAGRIEMQWRVRSMEDRYAQRSVRDLFPAVRTSARLIDFFGVPVFVSPDVPRNSFVMISSA